MEEISQSETDTTTPQEVKEHSDADNPSKGGIGDGIEASAASEEQPAGETNQNEDTGKDQSEDIDETVEQVESIENKNEESNENSLDPNKDVVVVFEEMEEEESSKEAEGDSQDKTVDGDADETVFEEVDAHVSTESAIAVDESDMLGESDMTVPEKDDSVETSEVVEEIPDKPSPMEVDNSSNEDIEMILDEQSQSAKKDVEKNPTASISDEKEKKSTETVEKEPEPQAEDDVDDVEEEMERMEVEDDTSEPQVEGADVVDNEKNIEDDVEVTKDKETNESEAVNDEGDENVDKPAENADNVETAHDDENEDIEKEPPEAAEKDSNKDDNLLEEIDPPREEDADPGVENVQEPEESDVCLLPDTETEMTDADKERAIQARENAEKESELVEDIAVEKEQSDVTSEETVQENLLEEMLPAEPTPDGGTPHKVIIFLSVSARHKCAQCDKQKVCGFRYKDGEKSATEYLCDMSCVDKLLAASPGKYFLRRKKFLVDEVSEGEHADHKCLQCKKFKSGCKYFFKQDEETFYICSEDCYKTLSTDEPEKFNLKRDSIRVRNIGHTTISSKGGSNTDTRIVSRSLAEAEAAKLERTTSFTRHCAECSTEIQLRLNGKNLIWQTMDFCDELCAGKYQQRVGSQCQTCHGEVPHQSLGKYCVRFGFDIRQFCCATCLNNYKKGLKTCSCCQKDISTSGEGFLAPVGDKEQFKDFCSQACMRRYDSMCNAKKKLRTDRCAVCNLEKPMRVEMTIDGNEQNFCSNPCFSAFKFVSNIVPDQCGMCSKYFERKSSECYTIYNDKQRPKVFCSRICFNVYIIVNRQITSCQWCKVKKYDFDMITKIVENRQVMMCSLNCLTLYGVSVKAFTRTAIQCDNCNTCTTPQYHLTMSDASMRNFCTYQCVMQFQSQFARIPLTLDSEAVTTATHHVSSKQGLSKNSNMVTPFPTGLPKRVKLNANQMKISSPSSPAPQNQQNQNNQAQVPVMPVISNVASLATGHNETMIGNTTVRRGSQRGRGRGKKFVNDTRPPRIPTPPPAPVPATRARSSTNSPTPIVTPHQLNNNKNQNRGRSSPRANTTTSTPIENARSISPIDKHIETKIITVPPYPPMVRNVQTSCRPKTEDASSDCRPETAEIGIQTDEDFSSKVLIPVPVPIYVPQPMYMYSAPFPVPVPIPLPIPVPIFIPTTRNSANGILKEIKKIQDKMPADPFEAELLMMAEMVADEKNDSDSDSEEETKPEPRLIPMQYTPPAPPANNVVSMEQQTPTGFGEDVLQIALKMASEEYEEPGVDLESAMTANTITNPPPGMIQSSPVAEEHPMQMGVVGSHMMMDAQRASRGRKRGGLSSPVVPRNNRSPIKRQRLSVDNNPAALPVILAEKPDANMCLKFTFGVNAWKQWVMTKNADIEKSSVRRRLFKTELLQMTADELNYSLCLFVKEVRKPNGTEYAPDTIYYLVLGIQQYLYENGRIDNIFTDPYYERFTDCLDEVARKFSVLYNDSQYIVTRVEEEHLWECKQLGAHSPHVLLSTLMFFNTKHFNLTTVEEHMQLSFSHIMKHWKRSAQNAKSSGTRNVLLRFYPPQAGLDTNPRKKKVYEQQENEENPLRCPVRLYEFYLSKCPESVKTRNDVFYLQPERSCVPDSPVWYSTQALSQESLQKMLHRVKMVKEINIALLTS